MSFDNLIDFTPNHYYSYDTFYTLPFFEVCGMPYCWYFISPVFCWTLAWTFDESDESFRLVCFCLYKTLEESDRIVGLNDGDWRRNLGC